MERLGRAKIAALAIYQAYRIVRWWAWSTQERGAPPKVEPPIVSCSRAVARCVCSTYSLFARFSTGRPFLVTATS